MDKSYGKICANPFSFCFEWKLPKFFSLIHNRKEYDSPEFEFCDAKWSVQISRYSPECMNFVLIKRNCAHRKHHVNFTLTIINGDGTEYAFAKAKHVFFSFSCLSEKLNVRYNKFLQDKHKISPDGTLTIFCTMRCDFAVKDTSSLAVRTDGDEFLDADESFESKACNKKEKEDFINYTDKEVIPTVIDSEKLIRDMESLFSNGQDSDVTLVVADRKFPVHRIILGIRSPVFAAMFRHDMEEKTNGIVTITDFEPDIFQDFLLYLYTAKVEKLSSKTVVGLYSAADKYDTQELKAKCAEFMRGNLSVDMICRVVSLALQHEESCLLEAATKFFVKNLKQIIVTVDWQTFMKENPATANELLIKATSFYVLAEEKL